MRKVVLTLLLLVVMAGIGFSLLYKRERTGIEFCPQTFEQRSFVYYVNAFGSYNMNREPPSPCDQAISSKLNPLTKYSNRKRWDLVVGNASRQEYDEAAIVTRYLDASSTATTWDLATWSKDNPTIAGLLWPRVQDLAVHKMYFVIPDLIQTAISSTEPSDFQSVADRLVTMACVQQLGYWLSRQRDHEADIRLLRLVDWLDSSDFQKAEVTNFEIQQQLDDLVVKAKSELASTVDASLTNEEVVGE